MLYVSIDYIFYSLIEYILFFEFSSQEEDLGAMRICVRADYVVYEEFWKWH